VKQTPFPPSFLTKVKGELADKQDKLVKQLANLKQEDPFADSDRLSDNAAVDADAAEQFDHQRVEAMTLDVEETLGAIGDALAKIDRGTYGLCERCTSVIEQARLMIEPHARLCIGCQKAQAGEVIEHA
jgi:DnaK suppressor protein